MKRYLETISKCQIPSFLVKDLLKADNNKNDKIEYLIFHELIKFMKDINIREIPENEILKKVVNIFVKILNFKEQQKDKEIKILTPNK